MKDILIWDQILVGTNCENIREEALKNQWNLDDLLWKGQKTESEIQAASQIKTEYKYNVKRVKDCEYSKHSKNKKKLASQNPKFICWKCENESCPGYNKYKYHQNQCRKCKNIRNSPEARDSDSSSD